MSSPFLSNPSQLVLRNRTVIPATRLLIVGYPPDDFLLQLKAQRPDLVMTAFGHDYGADATVRQRVLAAGDEMPVLHFGAELPPAAQAYDAAILFLPKSRPLLEMTLAQIAPALARGAPLFLVGENKAGIRSSQQSLEKWIGPPRTLDRARHCGLLQSTLTQPTAPFVLDDWTNTYPVDCQGSSVRVVTLPGVFSHGRLDDGTQLLLSTLTDQPRGAVLDWACGAGVIGVALLNRWPQTPLDLADVSALALASARQTLAANNLTARNIIATDIFSAVTEKYVHIIANPPFHSGVATDYQLVTAFVQGAAQHLLPGGRLRIVVQRFLKIRPLIEAYVGPCNVVAQDQGYVVYEGGGRPPIDDRRPGNT